MNMILLSNSVIIIAIIYINRIIWRKLLKHNVKYSNLHLQ